MTNSWLIRIKKHCSLFAEPANKSPDRRRHHRIESSSGTEVNGVKPLGERDYNALASQHVRNFPYQQPAAYFVACMNICENLCQWWQAGNRLNKMQSWARWPLFRRNRPVGCWRTSVPDKNAFTILYLGLCLPAGIIYTSQAFIGVHENRWHGAATNNDADVVTQQQLCMWTLHHVRSLQ